MPGAPQAPGREGRRAGHGGSLVRAGEHSIPFGAGKRLTVGRPARADHVGTHVFLPPLIRCGSILSLHPRPANCNFFLPWVIPFLPLSLWVVTVRPNGESLATPRGSPRAVVAT